MVSSSIGPTPIKKLFKDGTNPWKVVLHFISRKPGTMATTAASARSININPFYLKNHATQNFKTQVFDWLFYTRGDEWQISLNGTLEEEEGQLHM